MSDPVQMDIRTIREYLMHRYPFLLVDRVVECRPGSDIVAIKNVTVNEPFPLLSPSLLASSLYACNKNFQAHRRRITHFYPV